MMTINKNGFCWIGVVSYTTLVIHNLIARYVEAIWGRMQCLTK
ncbi:hypothetical protein SBF1_990017 [Candidatus Desulfosporosinus infrequens]|uniref:Uncharacterized protein n=1 Tax=Candidatus Desulfosporosinus infrequens TaxID=2043169 RepID=A0A2U3LYJ7_9FIRM|nr:hypothetical protein SBF1_990017 [Candidatus Desulfosporosinus infrequens]